MIKKWVLKEFFAKILALFFITKTKRRSIRDKIRFNDLVKSVYKNDFKINTYPKKINISFCFNNKGFDLGLVAIKSLLMSSIGRCDYKIYCVIDKEFPKEYKEIIQDVVKNTGSEIIFLFSNDDFNNSYLSKWPVAIYYRMMLPKLLPDVDNIIYADIDTIFFKDLIELSQIDMGENIIAGVKDYPNGYINSGFIVMNLKKIRELGLYEKWIEVSQIKKYKNPDQDLLNYTTRGKVLFLPLKYNLQTMRGSWIYKTHSEKEINDLKHNLVVMHYSNWMKPWHSLDRRPIFSKYWWDVAKTIPFWADRK